MGFHKYRDDEVANRAEDNHGQNYICRVCDKTKFDYDDGYY